MKLEIPAGLYLLVLTAASLHGSSCSSKEKLSPEIEKLGRATGPVSPAASKPAMGSAQSASKIHQGRVLETMDASRYTYLRLAVDNGKELWAAVPKAKVATDGLVRVAESLVMKDFVSPTTNKKFDEIVFGTLLEADEGAAADAGEGADSLPPGHPAVDMDPGSGGDGPT